MRRYTSDKVSNFASRKSSLPYGICPDGVGAYGLGIIEANAIVLVAEGILHEYGMGADRRVDSNYANSQLYSKCSAALRECSNILSTCMSKITYES